MTGGRAAAARRAPPVRRRAARPALCRAGEVALPLFRHPIDAHVPGLRRYARALRGNAADADDLVQDTLERAHAKWHLLRRGADPRPWLFAIMHGVFVNQVKAAAGRPRLAPLDDAVAVGVRAGQEWAAAAHDVASALGRLTDLEREVLLLVALEGLSYADAADVLQVPVGTVMSRLARARERLRQLTEGGEPAQEVTR